MGFSGFISPPSSPFSTWALDEAREGSVHTGIWKTIETVRKIYVTVF